MSLSNQVAAALERRQKKAKQAAGELDRNLVEQMEPGELVRQIAEEHTVKNTKLLFDEQNADFFEEADDDHLYTIIRVVIPIEGDAGILPQHPEGDSVRGEITIEGGFLYLRYSTRHHEQNKFDELIEQDLQHLKNEWPLAVDAQVNAYNSLMEKQALADVTSRKNALDENRKILERLGIPLRRLDQSVTEVAIPTRRRESPIKRQPASPTIAREYFLAPEEYEFVLATLSRMVDVMERSPSTFSKMGETELRNILLVILNGHYEIGATGETFNGAGKTDILLKYENRAAFIGECKIWSGPLSLTRALDQLRGYMTWRDTKCALLIFHRGNQLEKALKQIDGCVAAHPSYFRAEPKPSETQFRYTLQHPNDQNRQMVLAILNFHMRGPKK